MPSKARQRPPTEAPAPPTGPPLIVSSAILARLLGVHVDRTSKYVSEGMPALQSGGHGKPSEFDAVACLAWWRARRAPGTTEQERTRYFKASADKIEQEVRKRAGELIEAAEVDARWAGMVLPMREKVLALATVLLQRGLIQPAAEDEVIQLAHDALTELAQRGGDLVERA